MLKKLIFINLFIIMLAMLPLHAAIDAGRIAQYTQTLCFDKATDVQPIEVKDLQSASGESEISYCYLLQRYVSGQKQVIDTIFQQVSADSLSYDFVLADHAGIGFGDTLVISRAAKGSSGVWQVATGDVVLPLGQNKYEDSVVYVCRSELESVGYTVDYTYTDGRTSNYTFHSESEEHVFYDRTAMSCVKEVHVRCVTVDVPKLAVDSLGILCQSDSLLRLYFEVLEGNVTHCSLRFNQAAKRAHFRDTIIAVTAADHIELKVPTTQLGDYKLFVSFYDESDRYTCYSVSDTVSFEMHLGGFIHEKWDDVLFVDNNPSNCEPNCEEDKRFSSYQWYKNGRAIAGATGQTYYEQYGLNGYYYVMMTDSLGNEYRSCEIEKRPTTGLSTNRESLILQPNPVVAGELFETGVSDVLSVEIYDLSGRLVESVSAIGCTGVMEAPRVRGMYAVKVFRKDGGQMTGKLIVK
mgnify:CR=1 FL=1